MAWMIDGNKLKEKAVLLHFSSNMEPCGYIPVPVQAVIVDEIANMLYRDGIEIVRCKDCRNYNIHTCPMLAYKGTKPDGFCSYGERRSNERQID